MAERNNDQISPESIREAINVLRSPQLYNLLAAAASPESLENPRGPILETCNTVQPNHPFRRTNQQLVRPSLASVDTEIRTMFRSTGAPAVPEGRNSLQTSFNFIGSQRKRPHSRTRQPKASKDQHPVFIKNIVLLPDKSFKSVPRGSIKTSLENDGFVLYNQELRKEWSENVLQNEIIERFGDKITKNTEIEFLKASGCSLVIPKMSPGITLTGHVVHRVWGKGILYIRPKNDSDESDTDCEVISEDSTVMTNVELPIVDNHVTRTCRSNESEPEFRSNEEATILSSRAAALSEVTTSAISGLVTPLPLRNETLPTRSNDNAQIESTPNNDGFSLFETDDNTEFANLDEEINEISEKVPTTLQEIISKLSSKLTIGKVNEINVIRKDVMDGAFRAFSRKSFDPRSTMYIIFSDEFEQLEGGLDLGGPSREFFRLLIKQVMSSMVFEGPVEARTIAMHNQAIIDNKYYMAGLTIALSIVHGGPGPCCLSPLFFECLYKDPNTISVSPHSIVDRQWRERVLKLSNSENLVEVDAAIENLSDILQLGGINPSLIHLSQKEDIVKQITNYIVLVRNESNLAKFKDGLAVLGVLDKICQFPELFAPIMIYDGTVALTRSRISLIFKINSSEPGSNRFEAETVALAFWRDLLIDLEEGDAKIGLEEILIFATGADKEPPMGFSPQPIIGFLHENVPGTDKSSMFPASNTCALTLYLPVVNTTYSEFKKNMIDGVILGNTNFGRP